MGQQQLNSWRVPYAYTLSVATFNVSPNVGSPTHAGGAWLAEIRLYFPRHATTPWFRTRDAPQHDPEAAVRLPSGRVCAGGRLPLRFALHSALTCLRTTLRGALQAGLGATRRAHISHLCHVSFLTRTPEEKRLNRSRAALCQSLSDQRGAARQPRRPLLKRRCARGSGRHAPVESSSARARCCPNAATTLDFSMSPAGRSASVAAMRGNHFLCTLGKQRSGVMPASTRQSLAGQAPGNQDPRRLARGAGGD